MPPAMNPLGLCSRGDTTPGKELDPIIWASPYNIPSPLSWARDYFASLAVTLKE